MKVRDWVAGGLFFFSHMFLGVSRQFSTFCRLALKVATTIVIPDG